MPSVANLPAAVFDVRYAPNSDQILQRSEMTLCARYCCKKNFRILTRNIDSKNRPAAQH